jgi:hypothetical protein
LSTFVLVHGGWCYQRVARILRSEGDEVHAPTLTGVGERSHVVGPHVTLDLHIRELRAR